MGEIGGARSPKHPQVLVEKQIRGGALNPKVSQAAKTELTNLVYSLHLKGRENFKNR